MGSLILGAHGALTDVLPEVSRLGHKCHCKKTNGLLDPRQLCGPPLGSGLFFLCRLDEGLDLPGKRPNDT